MKKIFLLSSILISLLSIPTISANNIEYKSLPKRYSSNSKDNNSIEYKALPKCYSLKNKE